MKNTLLLFGILLLLSGCSWQTGELPQAADAEFVAPMHKEGDGISLCGATKESLGLKTVEVATRTEAGQSFLAVPRSAVLNTTSGTSVYVVNEDYYKRSIVKVGRSFDGFVEITEGVYEGDFVVTDAVQTLWLVELRAVKGGKGCCPMPDAKKSQS